MSVWRALAASRQARALAAIAGLWVAAELALSFAAPLKIDGAVPRDRRRVDVVATLRFPPERFHIEQFQRLGRVSGTDGPRVEVRGVRPDDLERLARPFWVVRVEPLRNQGG
ncbi:MAG: hypothetical protein N3D77_05850 [Geminicoccaceae bacterium]|nr:hypothetical protein [Geminicoccaceae bacterium]